jgi:hypothetical protein
MQAVRCSTRANPSDSALPLQTFVTDPKRIEVAISALYDSGSVLNASADVQELQAFMGTRNVSVMGAQGPAALLTNLVRMQQDLMADLALWSHLWLASNCLSARAPSPL